MKQTRWLSEFSCLSEYTPLYPIKRWLPNTVCWLVWSRVHNRTFSMCMINSGDFESIFSFMFFGCHKSSLEFMLPENYAYMNSTSKDIWQNISDNTIVMFVDIVRNQGGGYTHSSLAFRCLLIRKGIFSCGTMKSRWS